MVVRDVPSKNDLSGRVSRASRRPTADEWAVRKVPVTGRADPGSAGALPSRMALPSGENDETMPLTWLGASPRLSPATGERSPAGRSVLASRQFQCETLVMSRSWILHWASASCSRKKIHPQGKIAGRDPGSRSGSTSTTARAFRPRLRAESVPNLGLGVDASLCGASAHLFPARRSATDVPLCTR